jgi:hypothetical protein
VHVAYHLSAGVDIRGRVNLRLNPTERSNHGNRKIVQQQAVARKQEQDYVKLTA